MEKWRCSTNLELGGHSDWRLPELWELLSLVDHAHQNPPIAPLFDAFTSMYWSSTSDWACLNCAWSADFTGDGRVTGTGRGIGSYVRAVRTAP